MHQEARHQEARAGGEGFARRQNSTRECSGWPRISMIAGFRRAAAASIVPNAFAAAALEHVDDLPGMSVHHCSHQFQPFTAEAATPGRGTFDLCDFLCLQNLHGPTPIQSESRQPQNEYCSLEESCPDGNVPVVLYGPKCDSLLTNEITQGSRASASAAVPGTRFITTERRRAAVRPSVRRSGCCAEASKLRRPLPG